jgi:hypothetical protein
MPVRANLPARAYRENRLAGNARTPVYDLRATMKTRRPLVRHELEHIQAERPVARRRWQPRGDETPDRESGRAVQPERPDAPARPRHRDWGDIDPDEVRAGLARHPQARAPRSATLRRMPA